MHLQAHQGQSAIVLVKGEVFERAYPGPGEAVDGGPLSWGRVEEIGSPAYWASQSWMWELEQPDHYRLGRSLQEEVVACLLGGHGIPAEVGLAAYDRLRSAEIEEPGALCDEAAVLRMLIEPLDLGGRSVRYRFARQKARFVSAAMRHLEAIDVNCSDRELRDALTEIPGIGPKTASWIVRNWRGSDDVSILDVHILRAGRSLGIFPPHWRVERHYLELEKAFLAFARAIGAKASILDSVMWMTMRRLPAAILATLGGPQGEPA